MNGMKCACGKMAKYSEDLTFNGTPIDGWVCKACGEEYYNPEKAEKILSTIKKFHKKSIKTSFLVNSLCCPNSTILVLLFILVTKNNPFLSIFLNHS